MSNRWRGRVNSRREKGRKCLGIWGKRLQGRTKDKRKQGKFVSDGTSFHISPTADVSLVSSAFVLFWVTAETQRSGKKGQESNVNSLISPGDRKNKAVNRRQDVFQLESVFKQYKSVYQILGCSVFFCFTPLFFFFLLHVG